MTFMNFKTGTVAGVALMLTACGSGSDIETSEGVTDRTGDTMAEVVGDADGASTAASAFESTGLDGVLEGEASYTVLAPSDAAFEALGGDAEALISDEANGALVAAVLREHMVPGALTDEAIQTAITDSGGEVTMATFGSGSLTWSMDGEDMVVTNASGQSARVSGEAVVAKNGVLIPIDGVLADPASLVGSVEDQ